MQDQIIFGHGDTDPDLSVPSVADADAEDVGAVNGFGKPVVPTRREMINAGQQRRRRLGMPVSGPTREAEAMRFRTRVRAQGRAWRPRTSGTMFLEVFAGKGELTQAFKDKGITTLARIDIEGVGVAIQLAPQI